MRARTGSQKLSAPGEASASKQLSPASAFAVRFIETYQARVGPGLGVRCRFDPSCSVYAHQAYHKHGFLKATLKTMGRLSRCRKSYQGSLIDPP